MLWFNGDYPLYAFYKHHEKYNYYVMTEYDVVAQRSLDRIIHDMAEDELDFVGLTKGEAVADWPFTSTCRGVYPEEQIQKRLVCIAFFSNRAIRQLFKRRLEMSQQKKAGTLQGWPYCEAFIPTEIFNAGLRMAELDRFGSTDQYDWRPAILEADLSGLAQNGFIHPVLDPNHFAQQVVKSLSLRSIKNVRTLKRVPVKTYARILPRKLLELLWSSVRKRIRQSIRDW